VTEKNTHSLTLTTLIMCFMTVVHILRQSDSIFSQRYTRFPSITLHFIYHSLLLSHFHRFLKKCPASSQPV